VRIITENGKMKARVLQPQESEGPAPGILWIHGGGYMLGGSYMVEMSCGKMLAEKFGAVVGGESAGGGLTVAVCLFARDKGRIPIALQLPLYPMLDCEDTESSVDNHGRVWNTKRNHWGWKHYLGNLYGTDSVSKYASPARETEYSNLPPCYTFVADGEPFYAETLSYVNNLKAAGVEAKVDVYHGNTHAFDMLLPWQEQSKLARKRLCEAYLRLTK
jgi:acetyl esterase/lipase